jgi:hypothetical protein
VRRMIIKTLEFLIGVGVLAFLIGGTLAGMRAIGEEPLIGAIFGFLCGLIVAALIFGIVAAVLDIRDQLIRIRILLEDEAAARRKPPARVVSVQPAPPQEAAS